MTDASGTRETGATRRVAQRPAAHVVVGASIFPIEADRIHVLGGGEKTDIRLVHTSIAASHATLCAHGGKLLLEDLGSPGGTWLAGERVVGEREIPSGATVSIGEIPIVVSLAPPPSRPMLVAHPSPEPTFGSIMAEELRRAPWLGLSTLLHVLLFLMLYLLVPVEPLRDRGVARVQLQPGSPFAENPIDTDLEEPEIVAPETPDPIDQLPEEPVETFEPEPAGVDEAFEAPPSHLDGVADLGASLFSRVGGGGDGDVLRAPGGGGRGLSSGFRKTVAGLRETGLEIVFVVDSTGSMGPVIDATKRRMVRMLEALHALVPDARVGIVAYRDRGPGEEYLTRTLPLHRDLYGSLNFMQTITAGGGGDRPEAVFDALQNAVEQPWRQGAKRVVVVIGDAPAHDWAENDIDRLVGRFVRDGHGFVHTIMTATDMFGSVSRDTKQSFERIAEQGRGVCVPSEHEDRILTQVLSLAIGSEFRESIEQVFEILAEREKQFSSRARDAIRRADATAIEDELRRSVVEDGFVEGLIAARSREIVEALIAALRAPDLPPNGRNAAAYALQQLLALQKPPIDPLDPGPIDARVARDLRNAASRLR